MISLSDNNTENKNNECFASYKAHNRRISLSDKNTENKKIINSVGTLPVTKHTKKKNFSNRQRGKQE